MEIISNIDKLNLESLKIKKFRENYNTLYYDKKNSQYITIYNKPKDLYYLFKENQKFVNELIPGLKSIIVYNSKSRNKILFKGYIMKAGKRCTTAEQREFIDENKQKIIDFVKKNKYYYWDMTGRNAIYLKEEDKISLIDLESFKPVKVKKKEDLVKITGYIPDWYREVCESVKYVK